MKSYCAVRSSAPVVNWWVRICLDQRTGRTHEKQARLLVIRVIDNFLAVDIQVCLASNTESHLPRTRDIGRKDRFELFPVSFSIVAIYVHLQGSHDTYRNVSSDRYLLWDPIDEVCESAVVLFGKQSLVGASFPWAETGSQLEDGES